MIMIKFLNRFNITKYLRLLFIAVLILIIYFSLLYFKPGLNNIPGDIRRDASGMFYTEVENIDDLICVGAATSCEK